MLANWLAAALRNLGRNRVYAAISVFGLSVGISAALLVALVLRDQYGYEHFVAGYDRVYLALSTLIPSQREPNYTEESFSEIASHLKLRFREIESITRITDKTVPFRRGNVRAQELMYWADPNVFAVLRLPVVAGDLASALRRPDSIVVPRSIARKYFGRDAPIGATIELDGAHAMTVTAVIEDLPSHGTRLRTGIFASGLAPWSALTELDNNPGNSLSNAKSFSVAVETYLRLAPTASVEPLQAAMPAFIDSVVAFHPPGLRVTLTLVRVDRVHVFPGLNPGAQGRLTMSIAVGVITLLIACINFINLATARASQRAREVMVRKVAGAGRGALVAQFLGETFVYVVLAMLAALALTELLLPHVNAFVDAGAKLDEYAMLGAWLALGAVALSVLAGFYPAMVLSGFQPIRVLKGQLTNAESVGRTRQMLVTLQFALLTALILCAIVLFQQRRFALRDALRVSTDQHLFVQTPCNPTLKTGLQQLTGVRGVSCVSRSFLNGEAFSNVRLSNGSETALGAADVEPGAFELFDLAPRAGRFFATADAEARANVIVNESAVRRLGFHSPAEAIGKPLPIDDASASARQIIGVVPDFALYSVEREIAPTIYSHGERYGYMDVKLTGRQIPETLAALETLWKATGAKQPAQYFFLSDYVQDLYRSVLRSAQVFALFAGAAVVLASLGLIGLSTSITDRRIKEIGVRKAMGAGTGSIVLLLLRQFTSPVLLAAAIAWPVAGWLMSRWLDGFAYHVALTPLPFVASTALTLVVALLTVSGHSFSVARSKPVQALRYE